MQENNLNSKIKNTNQKKIIKVAILAEEPIGWGSGKHYFPLILDGYCWKGGDFSYIINTEYILDKEIINGKLNTSDFDVLLIPGGGVGDSESIMKGFTFLRSVKKWKKNILEFVKNGGGIVGICGGTALITDLITGDNTPPTTIIERLYNKSSLDISIVKSYYKSLAMPLFYPFQKKYPEKIGATSYIFSFTPGVTIDGKHIFSGGIPIDFLVSKNNPIFSDFNKDTVLIRWWGGPALILPEDEKRDIKILARYPIKEISDNKNTRIFAWRYVGGIHGLIFGFLKAFKFIKDENASLKDLFLYTYYFAGNWKSTRKLIDLNFSNKPCITTEVYPNENKGRILLCTAHPEYMIWHDGHIEEIDDSGFNCIANGFHQWKDIKKLSSKGLDELTHTWWMVRRFIAWAAKVPDDQFPPIEIGDISEKTEDILSKEIFWDDKFISKIKSI